MKKIFAFVIFSLFIFGCTDSGRSRLYAYGKEGTIQCYSGGKLIYEGISTGKLQTVSNSDGWEFREKGTADFIRVSGDCIIRN